MAATPSIRDIDAATIGDADSFRHEIAEHCEPVILRGLTNDWPVRRAASQSWQSIADYLLRFDIGAKAQVFVGDPAIAGRYHYGDELAGFNFERETLDLGATLERIAIGAANDEAPSVYMGSLPTETFLPGLAADNLLPLLDPTVEPRIWIGNASNVACHFDTFDNLACVVAGRRRFTLYPPDAIGDLYVGPLDHTMAGQPVGLAAGCAPGDPRYPRFEVARDRARLAELAPGDALYLPKLWWHQVEALDRANVLVNYWWDSFSAGPDAPFTTMLLAMIAVSERPPAERAAWRAFFDHYVFRPDGHPLAHLPADKHGVLGPLHNGNYGRIRAMVMQLLRGG